MSNASQANFGAAMRERDRRQARMLNGEEPFGLAQAAYLGPGWDAFYGSLHDQGDAANAAGMGYRVDLSGLGRMDDGGAGGGGLNSFDRDALKQQALSQIGDAATQQARAEKYGNQSAVDAQERGRIGDLYRAYDQQVQASTMAPPIEPTSVAQVGNKTTLRPAGTPEEQMLARLSPPERIKAQQDIAAAHAKQTLADAELKKAEGGGTLSGMNALYADTDPKAIAAAIRAGDHPPDMSQYGRPVQGAIASELAKPGPNGEPPYQFATALTDWKATQKHIATMNGAQQLRLNQSVNALPEMLDSVENLAKQWDGGRFPLLNRSNLTLAKNGAFGKDAASIATQLEAQLADVTADLGTIYMGGNSPTDHGLELAGKNLSGTWDKRVLLDAVTLARKNVQIRRNSINNTGVAGASASNPYAPQQAPAATQGGKGGDPLGIR